MEMKKIKEMPKERRERRVEIEGEADEETIRRLRETSRELQEGKITKEEFWKRRDQILKER